jgi:beta-phosphoglucomutase family hydrolase
MSPESDSPPPAAGIFDLDGTLVDTMPLHFEAYRTVFASLGLQLAEPTFYASIGGKASETIPRLLAGQPCPLTVSDLHARKKAVVEDLLRNVAIATLECARLLPVLRPSMRLALASSGSKAGIEIVLSRLNWHRYFDAVVTGEDVDHGKPAPDLFLLAASRLGVKPEACLVFEDTDAGVEAAARAGMQCFDVRRAAPRSWRH